MKFKDLIKSNQTIWKLLKSVQLFGFYVVELFYKFKNYNFIGQKNDKLKISFCTTCKGRLYDLKDTYIKNIIDNVDYANCEFVLVNYNSQDGLDSWVRKNLFKYIKSGKVVYFKNSDFEKFHMAYAKNCSHRLASGDILVNLDADNFTGKGFATFVNEVFNKYSNVIISTRTTNGANGRTAILKEHFYGINGYDEQFERLHDESDLIFRAKKKYSLFEYIVKEKIFLNILENDISSKKLPKTYQKKTAALKPIYEKNSLHFKENKKKGVLVANKNGFGKGKFIKNFKETVTIG